MRREEQMIFPPESPFRVTERKFTSPEIFQTNFLKLILQLEKYCGTGTLVLRRSTSLFRAKKFMSAIGAGAGPMRIASSGRPVAEQQFVWTNVQLQMKAR